MTDLGLDCWRVGVTPVPTRPTTLRPDLWRAVASRAMLAPSAHNTQPWRFQLRGGALELRSDQSRVLPVADPQGRELVISCGAALETARVELACRGLTPLIELLPDPRDRTLLAVLHTGGYRPPSLREQALRAAIARRRTSRAAFSSAPVNGALLEQLQRAAVQGGAHLHRIAEGDRACVADLVAEGDRRQGNDPFFRAELAAWLRPEAKSTGDGMPTRSYGIPPFFARAGIALLRMLPWGSVRARRNRELARRAPALLLLGTDGDAKRDWLVAGMALQRTLLTATMQGLLAGFLDQAMAFPSLRRSLGDRVGAGTVPQLLLRVGYGQLPPPTPRRTIDEIMAE
ncbi:MAG TPA: nitroreductase family protein [Gemmatimonadaceae bacterium]|nr:nitroreductase family protein [Gemmatimonadaceae bacterium]